MSSQRERWHGKGERQEEDAGGGDGGPHHAGTVLRPPNRHERGKRQGQHHERESLVADGETQPQEDAGNPPRALVVDAAGKE